MKRAILIHGWGGVPQGGWKPWLKKELEKKGFKVVVPRMPSTDYPKMNEWLPHLKDVIGKPDKDTYMVGHSLGCITILRYLEGLGKGEVIGGAVLVAGFGKDLGIEEIKSFVNKPVEWEKIRKHCKKFVAINSDNDPYVPLEHADLFKKELNAEVIIKHNMGHLGGAEDNVFELSDVLEAVLRLSE